MANENETPVEVTRESVVRLMKYARKHHGQCVERSYAQVWWEGYLRACEQILDMERE